MKICHALGNALFGTLSIRAKLPTPARMSPPVSSSVFAVGELRLLRGGAAWANYSD
jgi:hypothetical protein